MKRTLPFAAVLALGGCGVLPSAGAAPPAPSPVSQSPVVSAESGLGAAGAPAELPDPCTLLDEAEVPELTGRRVTLIDRDDAAAGASTRFCQWQQDGGQLAVFLSRTSADEFRAASEGGEPVEGVGESAYAASSHLYVLSEHTLIDVYAHGDDEAGNLRVATEVAQTFIPRI